jgi:hypothetical protein
MSAQQRSAEDIGSFGIRAGGPMAILLIFFNTEDDRALLAIATGVAWFTLGARSLMSAAH